MLKKTERIFKAVKIQAARKFPFLAKTALTTCELVSAQYERSPRSYAHTFCCARNIWEICVAPQIERLPVSNIKGILWHEMGHLIAGYRAPEKDADNAVLRHFGLKIKYDKELNLESV